jgi:CDP-diacylglycerol--glycerol-3-phosphate 3-phosphatidyltransferase
MLPKSYPQAGSPAMMPTILKTWLHALLHLLARILFDDGVRAIHVTSCAGFISVAVGVLAAAFAFHPGIFVLIPIWIIIRMLFNAVETLLITEFGQHSRLGTCAQELSRLVAETALFLPFSVIPKVSLLLVMTVTLLAIFSEFAGLLGPLIKASRRRDGPMKSDIRLLFFAVFGAGIGSGYALTAPINIALAVMTILLLMTIVTRIRRAVTEVAKPPSASPSKIDVQS